MGRGVAKILAQKGANVVIVARNQGRLDEAIAYVSVSAKSFWIFSFWTSLNVVNDMLFRLPQKMRLSSVSTPSPQT